MSLTEKTCIPCDGGVPPLNASEAQKLSKETPGWEVLDTYLTKTYRHTSFPEAITFVNKVAALAEEEGHHPDITITYTTVTLTLTTHAIAGLSENDFILAAKIDKE